MQRHGHYPGGKRGDQDNDHGVGQTFQTGTHIQFCQVDPACDERESGDDKEHGADVACLMSSGDRENMFQQPERTDVAQTRQGYGRDDAQIQRHMSAGQFTAKEVADAGADEGAKHFNGASAQQKSESRTCESGSQS